MSDSNMNVSIKNATDDELRRIMFRLENESRVQELIRRIRRNSKDVDFSKGPDSIDKGVPIDVPINSIRHFGIPGMKWGRRKQPDGSYKETGRSAKGAKRSKKVDVKKLSDKELRQKLNRLQMEKQYKDLTSGQKKKGKNVVNQILGEVGKEIAKDIIRETIKVGTDPAKDAARKKAQTAFDTVFKKAKKR